MKQTRLMKMLAVGVACTVAVGTAMAQQSSTTTTTTGQEGVTSTTHTTTLNGTGTISAYTPGSDYLMFRSASSQEPVRYYYTRNTVLVDPEGHALAWSDVRPDLPVTYTYVRDGDRMVVTKVTVNKPTVIEKETTTTTTTRP